MFFQAQSIETRSDFVGSVVVIDVKNSNSLATAVVAFCFLLHAGIEVFKNRSVGITRTGFAPPN